jgi:Tol biopolymer transport system component/chemotaxis protein histidine kinase CheA
VCKHIEDTGAFCWIAPRNVPAGKWGGAIMEAVAQSHIMVLVFSASSNNSANCLSEVHAAFSKNVKIIPLRIDDTEPSEDMSYYLQTFHWMDARTPPLEKHLQELVSRVKTELTQAAAKEKARQEAEAAKEKARREAEEARKAQEAAAQAMREAEEAAKEQERKEAAAARETARRELEEAQQAQEEAAQARKEAKEAREKAERELAEARKTQEAATKAKKEAEKAAREHAKQEAETQERARREAEKAKKAQKEAARAKQAVEKREAEEAQKAREEATRARKEAKATVTTPVAIKAGKPWWFWVGTILLSAGALVQTFMVWIPAFGKSWPPEQFPNYLQLYESTYQEIYQLMLAVIPFIFLGACFLGVGLTRSRLSKRAWLGSSAGLFAAGVVLPLIWMGMLLATPVPPAWASILLLFSLSGIPFITLGIYCLLVGRNQTHPIEPTKAGTGKATLVTLGIAISGTGLGVAWAISLLWGISLFGAESSGDPWYVLFSYVLLFTLPGVIVGIYLLRRGISGYLGTSPVNDKVGNAWWLLIVLGFIGGIFSWFKHQKVNWRQARNMLTAGILLTLVFTIPVLAIEQEPPVVTSPPSEKEPPTPEPSPTAPKPPAPEPEPEPATPELVREPPSLGMLLTMDYYGSEETAKLVLRADWDGNAEIYVMNTDGSGLKRLTFNDALDTMPLWSPDGSRILFISQRDGNDEIYVMNADGSGLNCLTVNEASDRGPKWSPDGSRIVFLSDRDGDIDLYTMKTDGSDQKRLTDNEATDTMPCWSPDGSKIIFSSSQNDYDAFEIYIMNADGSDQQRLTNDSAQNRGAVWSPDGTRIVFSSDLGGSLEFYTMNADGSDQKRLTFNGVEGIVPAWSPDGSRIAFFSEREGNPEIYVINADGSDLKRLTDNPAQDRVPVWSSDSSRIFFLSDREGDFQIYVMNADGSDLKRLSYPND